MPAQNKGKWTDRDFQKRANGELWEACKREAMGRSRVFTPDMMKETMRLFQARSSSMSVKKPSEKKARRS